MWVSGNLTYVRTYVSTGRQRCTYPNQHNRGSLICMVYSVDRPGSSGSLSARRQLLMMMGPSTRPAPGAEPFTQAESPRVGKRSSMSRAGGTSRARIRPLPSTRALCNGSKHRRSGGVRLDWRPGGRASPTRHSLGASTSTGQACAREQRISAHAPGERGRIVRRTVAQQPHSPDAGTKTSSRRVRQAQHGAPPGRHKTASGPIGAHRGATTLPRACTLGHAPHQ